MTDDIRKLAAAATPRPWYTDTGVIFGDINNGKWDGDNPPVLMPLPDKEGGFTKQDVADAKFATYCVNSYDALTARVAELEATLKPFAMAWQTIISIPEEAKVAIFRHLSLGQVGRLCSAEVTGNDFRRAAAAMEGK